MKCHWLNCCLFGANESIKQPRRRTRDRGKLWSFYANFQIFLFLIFHLLTWNILFCDLTNEPLLNFFSCRRRPGFQGQRTTAAVFDHQGVPCLFPPLNKCISSPQKISITELHVVCYPSKKKTFFSRGQIWRSALQESSTGTKDVGSLNISSQTDRR